MTQHHKGEEGVKLTKAKECGILPPRHDLLCAAAGPCLLVDRHDGPHECEAEGARYAWSSDDDCDCCDIADPDRCITWTKLAGRAALASTLGTSHDQ